LLVANQMAGSWTDTGQPCGKFLGIPNGSGEKQQPSLRWAKDNRLLPDDAPFGIGQELAFIQDDQTQGVQPHVNLTTGGVVQEVAQDLGGHDEDGGLRVIAAIARKNSDIFG